MPALLIGVALLGCFAHAQTITLGLAASWVVFAVLVWHEHRGPSVDFAGETIGRYLLTQAGVLTHYLRLAVAPSPLVFLYSWPIAPSLRSVGLQAGLLTALAGLSVVGVVRRHPLGFAGAWFFLILAPPSSVVPIVTEVAAEHRMYLPLASLVACAVVGAYLSGRAVITRLASVSCLAHASIPPHPSWTVASATSWRVKPPAHCRWITAL